MAPFLFCPCSFIILYVVECSQLGRGHLIIKIGLGSSTAWALFIICIQNSRLLWLFSMLSFSSSVAKLKVLTGKSSRSGCSSCLMLASGAGATVLPAVGWGMTSNLQTMFAYHQCSCCKAVSVFDYKYSASTVPACIKILCCDRVQWTSLAGSLYECDNCVK